MPVLYLIYEPRFSFWGTGCCTIGLSKSRMAAKCHQLSRKYVMALHEQLDHSSCLLRTLLMRIPLVRSRQLCYITQRQRSLISLSDETLRSSQRRCYNHVLAHQTRGFREAPIVSKTTNEWPDDENKRNGMRPSWSEEWKNLGLGATLVDGSINLTNLLFVQMGFGVDQHGCNDATKAAVRAVRNAIEFNSIPGVIEAVPGGRKEMLIHVKLGIPIGEEKSSSPMPCDVLEVAKVFPYGRLLPLDIVVGGLSFSTGRIVEELGDTDDMAVCVAACVSIGYNNGNQEQSRVTYNTKDGY